MLPSYPTTSGKGSLGSLCVLVLWTPRRLGTRNIFVEDDKMRWFSWIFQIFFCISWPVFLPYISFAIHDLDFSMLVIMCIYIYTHLFKVWLLYRWFLFPYVLFCVWALHPNQSSLIFGHGMSRPVRWKWHYLKGKDSIGRYSHFWLNHDYGRKGAGYHVFFLFGCLVEFWFIKFLEVSHITKPFRCEVVSALRAKICHICLSDGVFVTRRLWTTSRQHGVRRKRPGAVG